MCLYSSIWILVSTYINSILLLSISAGCFSSAKPLDQRVLTIDGKWRDEGTLRPLATRVGNLTKSAIACSFFHFFFQPFSEHQKQLEGLMNPELNVQVPIYDNAAVEHQLRADRDEMLAPGTFRADLAIFPCSESKHFCRLFESLGYLYWRYHWHEAHSGARIYPCKSKLYLKEGRNQFPT